MEGFVIASQYLISKRRLDFSEIPVLSGLTRLLMALAIVGVAVGGLELAAADDSAGPTPDATIADTHRCNSTLALRTACTKWSDPLCDCPGP